MAAIANSVGCRHKSRESAPCNWNTWLFCCYFRHGRRVNSLCQITERLLFFRINTEPPKRLLDHIYIYNNSNLLRIGRCSIKTRKWAMPLANFFSRMFFDTILLYEGKRTSHRYLCANTSVSNSPFLFIEQQNLEQA